MPLSLKKSLLIWLSAALLLSGGALLYPQIRVALMRGIPPGAQPPLTVSRLQGQPSDLQGAFAVDSVDKYVIKREGKEAFSLLLTHYKDGQQERRVLLFPKETQKAGSLLPKPMELRHTLWQEAAKAISQNTPQDALFLSWWDDGQRIHFLSGKDAWLKEPSKQTFNSLLWQPLQANMLLAADSETERLAVMARWLTMDCDQALAEIKQTFGATRPVYLLVTNDLLFRLAELADYGGSRLAFAANSFDTHDNLHGDIARIKQWAQEQGDGNYLVQKEGLRYHVWVPDNGPGNGKNALLVRILPFVNSLKKLPDGLKLVYQSHWGGYLAVYQLSTN
ncbi:hypothetical protein MCAMS1_01801 [biofilm metagenome]